MFCLKYTKIFSPNYRLQTINTKNKNFLEENLLNSGSTTIGKANVNNYFKNYCRQLNCMYNYDVCMFGFAYSWVLDTKLTHSLM